MTCIVACVHDDAVWMGGDSVGSDAYAYDRADKKVFRNGDYIIGFSGSYRLGQIAKITTFPEFPKNFLQKIEAPKNLPKKSASKKIAPKILPQENLPVKREDVELWFIADFVPVLREALIEEGKDEQFDFLVGVDRWLVCIESDYQVGMYKSMHMAIGSGALLALGALSVLDDIGAGPEEKIIRSISVAGNYDKAVGGNITLFNTKDYNRTIYEMEKL